MPLPFSSRRFFFWWKTLFVFTPLIMSRLVSFFNFYHRLHHTSTNSTRVLFYNIPNNSGRMERSSFSIQRKIWWMQAALHTARTHTHTHIISNEERCYFHNDHHLRIQFWQTMDTFSLTQPFCKVYSTIFVTKCAKIRRKRKKRQNWNKKRTH